MKAKPPDVAGSVASDVARILGPGGAIAQLLDGYEARPQQIEMATQVAQAVADKRLLVAEAATGTGKSLAYLIPLGIYAAATKQPVVISSSTHVLQDQLINKDLPLVKRVLQTVGIELKAVEVKGVGAYACQRDLQDAALGLLPLDTEGTKSVRQLHEWMKKSIEENGEGSRSDAPRVSDDLWSEVRADRDTCTREQCAFYSTCFLYAARRRIAGAHLLVANHSLVFADLAVKEEGGEVLPRYSVLVLDEAHKMEDAGTSFLGSEISPLSLRAGLTRLHGARNTGALERLIEAFPKLKLPEHERRSLTQFIRNQVQPEVTKLLSTVEETFHNMALAHGELAKSESHALRLTAEVYAQKAFLPAATAGHHLASAMELTSARLRAALNRLTEAADLYVQKEMQILRSNQARLMILAAQVRSFFDPMGGVEDTVKWMQPERSRRSGMQLHLKMAPLEVAPHLEQRLFKRLDAAVLTSATMAVGHSLEYFNERAGLAGEVAARRSDLVVDSPFDFSRQALAGFPTDLPDPDHEEFLKSAARFLWRALKVSRGRSLVLFHSWSALRQTHALLAPHSERLGFRLLLQGEMSKKELIRVFREDVNSVLLATAGYREGIDVPGEALCNLVLHRLPFAVPDEPVVAARMEALTRAGKDAFRHYSLPQAAIAFKQAFGRLIRRQSDFGVFLCLDGRVIKKQYGRSFLAALPKCRIIQGSSDAVLREMRRFLAMHERSILTP